LFIRNDLSSNVTDPIAGSRSGRDRFVRTSYPKRPVTYPIITVRCTGIKDVSRLGMRSELHWLRIPIEVRIWARNEKERDDLTQDVYNRLRSNQFGGGASSSDDEELHDFLLQSSVLVDEEGEGGIKSCVMLFSYSFIAGS